jgi:DNA-binding NarL/FixJ family response regulator
VTARRLLAVDGGVLVASSDSSAAGDVRRALEARGVTVASAHSVSCAIDLAARRRPGLVIADVDLGGLPADLRFVHTIAAQGASVVLLTDRRDGDTIRAVAAVGAAGVLRKPIDALQLELTLLLALECRTRTNGSAEAPVGRASSHVVLEDALRRIAAEVERVGLATTRETGEPALLARLRPREQQVVRLLLRHYRVAAIARELSISPETVRNHLKHVFRRTGVHSQQELLARLT